MDFLLGMINVGSFHEGTVKSVLYMTRSHVDFRKASTCVKASQKVALHLSKGKDDKIMQQTDFFFIS